MVTKVTFVGEGFTRKPPKYERFIRPMALRFKKAHVTHPELQTTFQLPILAVKKNPSSQLFSQLGVITKGTVLEVNVIVGLLLGGAMALQPVASTATRLWCPEHGSGWFRSAVSMMHLLLPTHSASIAAFVCTAEVQLSWLQI